MSQKDILKNIIKKTLCIIRKVTESLNCVIPLLILDFETFFLVSLRFGFIVLRSYSMF